MKDFKTIIENEKEKNYHLKNKELFALYTFTLINQEEARIRHKRNLIICGVLAVLPTLYFLPLIETWINTYIGSLVRIFVPLVYKPEIVYLAVLFLLAPVVLNGRVFKK